jgi:hypothetical protein
MTSFALAVQKVAERTTHPERRIAPKQREVQITLLRVSDAMPCYT